MLIIAGILGSLAFILGDIAATWAMVENHDSGPAIIAIQIAFLLIVAAIFGVADDATKKHD